MVWPIDAPKGRFPSKIAHYRGEGRGTPIYPAAYPQPDTPTSHNSTTHANQVRSATSHCCVPTAASRQWALQPRRLLLVVVVVVVRLLLTPLAALQHCRPSAAVRCSRRHPIIVLPASAQHSSIKGVGARGSCVRGAAIIHTTTDANAHSALSRCNRPEACIMHLDAARALYSSCIQHLNAGGKPAFSFKCIQEVSAHCLHQDGSSRCRLCRCRLCGWGCRLCRRSILGRPCPSFVGCCSFILIPSHVIHPQPQPHPHPM